LGEKAEGRWVDNGGWWAAIEEIRFSPTKSFEGGNGYGATSAVLHSWMLVHGYGV